MKKQNETEGKLSQLPVSAADFIKIVIKKMRYRKKVRRDVMAELAAHFEDELRGCKTSDEKEQKAQQLINKFGDAKLLGVLLRRAKKRCRSLRRKFLVHTFQVLGIVVLYIVIRVVFLMVGTPNISIDYVDWLNSLVRANRPEKENAQSYYNKAIELYVERPPAIEQKRIYSSYTGWLADFNDLEVKCLSKWLIDNQPAFEMLRHGASKPHYWLTYSSDDRELISSGVLQNAGSKRRGAAYWQAAVVHNIFKQQAGYKKVARAMAYKILYEANNGHINLALNDCIALQKFSGHLQGKGLLIEQLVGISTEGLANKMIFITLEKTDIEAEKLKRLLEGLQQQISSQQVVIDLEAEKAFWYDLVQRGFTDDGKGGGRVLKEGLPLVIKDVKSSLSGFFFFNYPDRREVVATIDRYFSQVQKLLKETPYQLKESSDSQKWDELGKELMMLKILGPAHVKIGQLSWRLKTGRAGLLTTLAVLRYKKENGEYPLNLQELVKRGYLTELPMDPYSDKPLVYKKTDDGFLLYSVGVNLKDDSGQIVRDDEGKIKRYADEGDWVFWPAMGK